MPTLIQLIDREIQPKGKAYLMIENYDEADFFHVMDAAFLQMEALGARELYLAARAENLSPSGDTWSVADRTFTFDTNFWILEKELKSKSDEKLIPGLRMKKLADWNLDLYIALYNECFFSIPNSRTMKREDGEALLSDANREAGFFMMGGTPVGIFELAYTGPTPEINSIALLEGHRGKGMGKRALQFLEQKIQERGFTSCQVLSAESNKPAMALYNRCGYGKKQLLSRWYCCCLQKLSIHSEL